MFVERCSARKYYGVGGLNADMANVSRQEVVSELRGAVLYRIIPAVVFLMLWATMAPFAAPFVEITQGELAGIGLGGVFGAFIVDALYQRNAH